MWIHSLADRKVDGEVYWFEGKWLEACVWCLAFTIKEGTHTHTHTRISQDLIRKTGTTARVADRVDYSGSWLRRRIWVAKWNGRLSTELKWRWYFSRPEKYKILLHDLEASSSFATFVWENYVLSIIFTLNRCLLLSSMSHALETNSGCEEQAICPETAGLGFCSSPVVLIVVVVSIQLVEGTNICL